MSTLEIILEALDESRLRLLVAIEPLPDAALIEKGIHGSWSIADILVNITVWEAELVTGMMHLDQGKPAKRMVDTLKKPVAFDLARYEENKDRDLDFVFADLQQVRKQLEDWLGEFTEKELTNHKRYPSLIGKSLAQVIARMSYEHEGSYLDKIESFAENWLANNDRPSPTVISLSTVEATIPENNHENTN